MTKHKTVANEFREALQAKHRVENIIVWTINGALFTIAVIVATVFICRHVIK